MLQKIKIEWKFRNTLVLCLYTELCHKNSMIGLENGPFTFRWQILPVWLQGCPVWRTQTSPLPPCLLAWLKMMLLWVLHMKLQLSIHMSQLQNLYIVCSEKLNKQGNDKIYKVVQKLLSLFLWQCIQHSTSTLVVMSHTISAMKFCVLFSYIYSKDNWVYVVKSTLKTKENKEMTSM